MQKGIHPKLKKAQASCTGCGNSFETLSILDNLTVSICSECHPFFTGQKRLLDTEGRIEQFKRRYQNVTATKPSKKKK
ncbi:MAG: 50S ribosomal protein L31 [Candidatus Caenarcaniphilales bacterium]|nr:50S ribosomal protein L31 [Candidatus Caenarcaniphilales bacterium]